MNEKQIAARKAVEFITNGKTIGLGTGSTVSYFLNELAVKIKAGLKIKAVSTSLSTSKLASSLGIEITDLSEVRGRIDLTIDGADEVDENLNGIKGGGGALLFEKIVARNSSENIWIVDSSKLVKTLGKFPLPVEVVKFGADLLFNYFTELNYKPKFRMINNERFITDGNHYIIDLNLTVIANAEELDVKLKQITGVVETGLFLGIADKVIVGKPNSALILDKKKRPNHLNV